MRPLDGVMISLPVTMPCHLNGQVGVVVNHITPWAGEETGSSIAQKDRILYTHILYLDDFAEGVAELEQNDTTQTGIELDAEALRSWQYNKKAQARIRAMKTISCF